MPSMIHFIESCDQQFCIEIMRLTKLFLLGMLSFGFLGFSQGHKLSCAKEESKKNQQNAKNVAEGNKIDPVEYGVTNNKLKVSPVLFVKSKQKNPKKLSEKNETMEVIREKLMKTLLENGDVKNVNSHGLTSEEAANRNQMESKHEEVWALMDEIMKRKNVLRKEIEEFYKRGLPQPEKPDEPEESEQIGGNSDEDYSEESLSGEEKESESEEVPDELIPCGKGDKKSKSKRNWRDMAAPVLEMSQSERSEKVKKTKFPNTEKYPKEVGTVLEDASDEETNNKRNENELRNKNMQLSKLFVQQMKEIYDMETKSRKAQRNKRHYESQIPFPYETSQECESCESCESSESLEKIQRNTKKRTAIEKKFYIIDNDPLGFYYYFKQCQKRDPNHQLKVYPAIELSKSKLSKKKSSKKRAQQSKKKRLQKKKRRYDGILIKEIEEKHVNDPRNSNYFENFFLPQSTQLQAKYLFQNGNQAKLNKKDRPIPNSEFIDYDDYKSSEDLKVSDAPKVVEYQQILTNDKGISSPKIIGLPSEDKIISVTLEHTTESNIIRTQQINNDTENVQFHSEKINSNLTTEKELNGQFDYPQLLQQTMEVSPSLEVAADETPKVRVPRSCTPTHYGSDVESCGDCSDCEQNCNDASNWDDLNMYLDLFKKLFDDKSCEDLVQDTLVTTTQRITTADNPEEEEDTAETSTSAAYVVPPGNSGLNLNKIADEINEAIKNGNSDTIVPFEEPPVGSSDPSQPTKKTEQDLLLKRPNGFWLPLKLVQSQDGRFNIQLDLKYICRRCTKQRQKRRRKHQRFDSNESH